MKGKIGLVFLVVLGLFLLVACEDELVMGSSSPDSTSGSSSTDSGSGSSSSTGFSEMTAFLSSAAVSNDFDSSVADGNVSVDSTKAEEINNILSSTSYINGNSPEVRDFIILYTGLVEPTYFGENPSEYSVNNYYVKVNNIGETTTNIISEADVTETATNEEFHFKFISSSTPQEVTDSLIYKGKLLEYTYNRSTSEKIYMVNGNTVSKDVFTASCDSQLVYYLIETGVKILSGEEIIREVITSSDPLNAANKYTLVSTATSSASSDQYSIVKTLSAEIDGHNLSIKATCSDNYWNVAGSLFNPSCWNEWTILNFTYDEVMYQISSLSIFDS